MAEVLLINPSYGPSIRKSPLIAGISSFSATLPLSVLYLASYLLENGVETKIVDTRLFDSDSALREIQKQINSVSLVGVSVMTNAIPEALLISDFIKSQEDIPIVWGGVHPTLFPEQTLKDNSLDYVIVGEGEVGLLKLFKNIKYGKPALNEIPNLGYKDPSGRIIFNNRGPLLDVNTLPSPAYHLLPLEKYIHRIHLDGRHVRVLDMQTSRGCPYRCAFCINVIMNKRIYRAQKPQKALSHINSIVDKYKLNLLNFLDENFFVIQKRTERVLEGLIELDVEWVADCRADYLSRLSEDFLNLIRRSGCIGLNIGAESGSQRILNMLKKDIIVKQIYQAVYNCRKHDIQPIVSFMILLPEETKDDMIATFQLMLKLKKMHPKIIFGGPQPFRPYPGGELYESCLRHGLKEPVYLRDWAKKEHIATLTGYIDSFPWIEDEKTVRLVRDFVEAMNLLNLGSIVDGSEDRRVRAIRPLFGLLVKLVEFRWARNSWEAPLEIRIMKIIQNERIWNRLKSFLLLN